MNKKNELEGNMENKNKNTIVGKFRLSEAEESFIRSKVSALPYKERLAIYFLFWEQRTPLNVASEFSMSVREVSYLVSHAMTKLRSEFTDIADSYFGVNNIKALEQPA